MTLRFLLPLLSFVGLVILSFRRSGRVLKRWQFLTLMALFLTLGRVLIPGLSLRWYALFLRIPSILLLGFLSSEWLALEKKSRLHTRDIQEALSTLALPSHLAKQKPDVAIVIPVYNEADNLRELLSKIPQESMGQRLLVVFVDDGSSDDTRDILGESGHLVLRTKQNLGKGVALQLGMRVVEKLGVPLLVTMDADGQHSLEDLPGLLKPLLTSRVDVVVGSRLLGQDADSSVFRRWSLQLHNRVLSFLVGQKVTDCRNSFRAFRTVVLKKMHPIQESHHSAEFLLEAFGSKCKVVERSITLYPRSGKAEGRGGGWEEIRFFKSILISWWRVARGIW